MHAYALASQESGMSVVLWASAKYFENHEFLRSFPQHHARPCAAIIVLNMSLTTVLRSVVWRLQGRKIVFCVHEPISKITDFQNLKLSTLQLAKLRAMRILIRLQIVLSSMLIAYSRKTVSELNKTKPIVTHPLLYVDQNTSISSVVKDHIAYIGTIANDHAFPEFVAFVEHCLEYELFPNQRFLIATRSEFDKDHFVRWGLQKAARVSIQSGCILSDSQINACYSRAKIVWCAYSRSNQSGVLPKAYMFGSPVIVLAGIMDDHFQAGVLGEAITSYAVNDIVQSVNLILNDYTQLSKNCRRYYTSTFDYKANLEAVKKLVHTNG